jgi:membrane dipeptidase
VKGSPVHIKSTRSVQFSRREFLGSSVCAAAVGFNVLTTSAGAAAAPHPGPNAGRLVVDGLDASAVNEEFLNLMRRGGVHCRHVTKLGYDSYPELYGFMDAHADEVVIARSVREIRQAHEQGKLSFIIGAQAAGGYSSNDLDRIMMRGVLGNMDLLASALENFKGLGMRTQGICYNGTNVFGGGCLSPTVPLTRPGRRLVEEIHKHRILLDVGGHTGERTSLDAIEMSSGVPIVATHTNMATMNNNIRCISDRLAEAIARTGGVIGLTAISDFHVRNPESAKRDGKRSPRAKLERHLQEYDYLKKLVGVDHIGLGPDFIWGLGDTVPLDPKTSDIFPPEYLSEGIAEAIDGFANISELPNLIRGLEQRGWSQPELDKVLGENWLRVYQQAWGA